ncbi:MAG: adenosine kinase [Mangrovibacterium sp.]
MSSPLKIVGIGSALVDVLAQLPNDELLAQFKLAKGSMELVDANQSKQIIDAIAHLKPSIETGGSAANTIRAIAQLGGKTGFIGKVNNDEMGLFFQKSFEDLGISFHRLQGDSPSGVASTLITPDSERTFGTYLGAASELKPSDLNDAMFKSYDILHIEGYLVFNHNLIEDILKRAKKNGLKISLDMASFNVVEANLDFMKYLLDNYVDIVFANEEEAMAYTGKEPAEAIGIIAQQCEVTVVKVGSRGSLIQADGSIFLIPAYRVEAIDTTGAGDVYAAGFLYGMAHKLKYNQCGRIGSLLASEVIKAVGAKIPEAAWEHINKELDAFAWIEEEKEDKKCKK